MSCVVHCVFFLIIYFISINCFELINIFIIITITFFFLLGSQMLKCAINNVEIGVPTD